MKKTVYTLCVDNYFPELCAITLPTHAAYAKRIGAEFVLITDRKYPEWHPTYEKMQIWDLGKENDWNIHIDADMYISPYLHDVTGYIAKFDSPAPPYTVGWYSIYDPKLYYKPNRYFMRDERNIGICSAFIAVPSLCHEIWEPFTMSYDEALKGTVQPHGLDDYCMSINFAKYGLKGDFCVNDSQDLVHFQLGPNPTPFHKDRVIKLAQAADAYWMGLKNGRTP